MLRQLGDEWVLYDSGKGSVHILNSMAEQVWNMCDGSKELDGIEQYIRDSYDVPDGADVRKDLEDIIRNFTDLGVIDSIDA